MANSGTAGSTRTTIVAPDGSFSVMMSLGPALVPFRMRTGESLTATLRGLRSGGAAAGARSTASSTSCTCASVSGVPSGSRPVTTARSKRR